ncbi:MAG: translation initiation factor [Victivallales bacterium]|nr:translation initiation factor [Victivallales bacterium]
MAKKKQLEAVKKEPEIGVNLGNPFAGLKLDVELPPPPEPPKPAPPPPPTHDEQIAAQLSKEDQVLLKAFAEKSDGLPSAIGIDKPAQAPKGPRIVLVIQKKGHKGRVVTLAHGFKELTFTEQMDLCYQLKTALGVGARFLDGTLEIQGDQRQRAAAWLSERNFNCVIPK